MDSSGNLYFTSINCVFKLDATGTLTLIAGTSRPGYSGDGGAATSAQLNGPQGLAVDSLGNIYVADSLNHSVRMVSPSGVINTLVGTGTPGYTGDGGLANGAQLDLPGGLAFDQYGNLYIADTANNVIRIVTPAGNILTFAGIASAGYSGDGAAANLAQLSSPTDVAVDSMNNVYIADTNNSVIRQVTTDNNIHTFAGDNTLSVMPGNPRSSGDGGAATSATLNQPHGVAVDSSGNVYLSEFGDSKIRKITKGIISTIAGTGTYGYTGDGSTATSAELANPWGLSVDSSGNVYIADLANYRIRKIAGTNISTVAGTGLFSYSGDGGPAARSQMNGPRGVAIDAAGNLYIADTGNNGVRKVAKGAISTLAGSVIAGFAGDNGPAISAQLNAPQAVAADAAGNVYVADTVNNRIREISAAGIITTFAGSGTAGYAGDNGPAANAQLNAPRGLAVDKSGNVYIADFNNNVVRKVSQGTIVTVAGTGALGFSGDGGQATAAQLNGPVSVAVDGAGDLYISDYNNYRIRMVSPKGIINTIAGSGTSVSTGDGGPAVNAQLAAPGSLVVDSSGNLYFVDSATRVRKISPDGTIATIAGNGTIGYSGDGGLSLSAQLNSPSGLALDASNNLYIADTGNNAIRLLQPVSFNLTISSVVNSASLAGGPISPGEVVVIFGSGLGPAQLTSSTAVNGVLGTSLAGTRVLVNGVAAPLLYTWATQVAFVVPYATSGSTAQVVVQYQNQTSTSASVSVGASSPALFTSNTSGQGQAAAFNQDGTLNSASNPAKAGSTITLFATGTGQTSPAGVDGLVTPSTGTAPQPVQNVTVVIGGQPAMVLSAANAAGSVAGVTQIKAVIPSQLPTGNAIPVFIQQGSVASPSGVTIAVVSAS